MPEANVYSVYGDKGWDEQYRHLFEERLKTIHHQDHTSASLQVSHESIITKAVCLALKKTESEWGKPPTHFAFFLMGSGGRREQSFWSDQDHGLVFDSDNEEDVEYFLHFGAEIVYALEKVGYKRCDGNVMASSSRWCRSSKQWEEQVRIWLRTGTWETLRYTLTFVDSTPFYGQNEIFTKLKRTLFQMIKAEPFLLQRFTENTGRLKKGIGLFNQLLVEPKGKHQGEFDFKQIVLFPYVNSLRLLALEQQILSSSTLERFQQLPDKYVHVKEMKKTFTDILEQQLIWHKNTKDYEDIHYLKIDQLNKEERKLVKKWVKQGHRLYQEIAKDFIKG
ncbi:DUF294 nucleotidyltransferase-like domain-containing protein [Halalkalibacter krulwichiae]|uniref:Putative nucleotidyltransferase substrate binding domain protein n=1 Tax=Halalkalibacter krulwichiae TaxID=199441 RepID=A0A1X9MLM8_9BACI|nr:DUF294 nucleotidyltransferase-like domain-containing protein [Halalkalibacter krulwichiae]ARK32821.1 Putative nucleotidyltransferase substrate binding domain protein [Halalkalibacter krulwichiae]